MLIKYELITNLEVNSLDDLQKLKSLIDKMETHQLMNTHKR